MMNQQQVPMCDFQFDRGDFTRLPHKILRASWYTKDLLVLVYVYVCLPYRYVCYELHTFITHGG